MNKRVSLRDVAAALGLDKSTISLALRHHPRIPEATRRRIEAQAKKMGYVRDPMLAALARYRWSGRARVSRANIAFLRVARDSLPDQAAALLAAAKKWAAESGYHLDEIALQDFDSPGHARDAMIARGIRGVLVGPTDRSEAYANFDWSPFCAVQCGMQHEEAHLHVVRPDAFRAVELCWRKARELGCRRIGISILHGALQATDRARIAAAEYLLRHEAAAHDRLPLHLGRFEDAAGFLAWYRRVRPDALIVTNVRAWWILRDAGLRPDESIPLLVLSRAPGEDWVAGCVPRLDRVAEVALELMEREMERGEFGPPEARIVIEIEPEWKDGSSRPAEISSPGSSNHSGQRTGRGLVR